jgi:hypothetical protein
MKCENLSSHISHINITYIEINYSPHESITRKCIAIMSYAFNEIYYDGK